MDNNININKISFSEHNNFIFSNNNMSNSFNFIEDSQINNKNNNTLNNQAEEFQKKLQEYETKNNQNNKKFHFDFKGGLSDKNLNTEEYPEDSLMSVVSKNNCRILTNANYIVFENNYGENSCYLNVLLHFLYSNKDIFSYLCYLYIDDKSNKAKRNEKNNIRNKDNNICIDEERDNISKKEFVILLGKVLFCYDKALKNVKNRVTQLKTIELRNNLNKVSNGKFGLNNVGDTIDLLNYIFEILNRMNNEDMENNFCLKLHEEHECNKCDSKKNIKYGNDNFIYHIYIEEIIDIVSGPKRKLKNYINKLFKYTQMTYLKDRLKCSKCQKDMNKKIICDNYPNNLIINCVWNEEMPSLDKVLKFFALFSVQYNLP